MTPPEPARRQTRGGNAAGRPAFPRPAAAPVSDGLPRPSPPAAGEHADDLAFRQQLDAAVAYYRERDRYLRDWVRKRTARLKDATADVRRNCEALAEANENGGAGDVAEIRLCLERSAAALAKMVGAGPEADVGIARILAAAPVAGAGTPP